VDAFIGTRIPDSAFNRGLLYYGQARAAIAKNVGGSTGTVNTLLVGTTYQVTVRLTDRNFNLVTGGGMPDVHVQTNDGGKDNAFGWDPTADFALIAG